MEKPVWLFRFEFGGKFWDVTRLSDERYKFTGESGSYNVPSWKRECYLLSKGKVKYA